MTSSAERFHQLDSIAERIRNVYAQITLQRLVLDNGDSVRLEMLDQRWKTDHQQCGMSFAGQPEIRFDAQVNQSQDRSPRYGVSLGGTLTAAGSALTMT